MIKKVLILSYPSCYVEKDYRSAEERINELQKEHRVFIVLDITHATECDLVEIGSVWSEFDGVSVSDIEEMYKDLVVDTSDFDEFYYWWYNK